MQPIVIIPLENSYAVNINSLVYQENPESPFWFEYRFGSFISALYNTDINYVTSKIISTFKHYDGESLDELIDKCFENIGSEKNKHNDLVITTLLLNEIHAQLNEHLNNEIALQDNSADEDVALVFGNFVLLKKVIESFIDNKLSKSDLSQIIKLQMFIDAKFFLDNSEVIRVSYTISEVYSLFALDFLNVQTKKTPIRRCENCGLLFLPKVRSDEVYCDRIFKDGKTCKQVGYSIKEKNDPFKHLFTTARKTQHARIRYNEHIKDYKEKHYIPWLAAAQEAKKKYEATNDIDGFRKWIEDNKNVF